MTVTLATFVADYPEFSNGVLYPPATFNLYSALANQLLNQSLWGLPAAAASSPPTALFDFGIELFVAHHFVLSKKAVDAAAVGGTPGVSTGVVSSKSVGGVSINYDVQAGLDYGDSHWNLTVYGVRFIHLAKQLGAIAPVVIGQAPPDGFVNGPAWPGPPFFGFSN